VEVLIDQGPADEAAQGGVEADACAADSACARVVAIERPARRSPAASQSTISALVIEEGPFGQFAAFHCGERPSKIIELTVRASAMPERVSA
jgi:hypothetical protein